ncbi:MAG: hypothetical protein ACRECY_12210 [Phyllobacterium sp.]
MKIAKPRHPQNHPARFTECQRAIEDSVVNVIGEAIDAGWDRDEVLAAMIDVTDNMALAMHSDISLDAEIARIRKRKDV